MDADRGRTPGRTDRSTGRLTVYAALWRALPGPVWVRLIILIVLIAAVLYALATWVFPWVQSFIDPQEVTVEE